MIRHSATLALNERLRAKQAAGERVLHLGFGEAGLPVLPEVTEVLTAARRRNEYTPVAGTPEARAAAAGYFTRRGIPTEPDHIVLAPGSKPLLFTLLTILRGDLVLPSPCWVSYAAQAAIVGKRVLSVDVPAESGGIPDPERLDRTLTEAKAAGHAPGILLLTVPDNPTGTVAPPTLVKDVCAVAATHGLTVLSDEIYRDLVHGEQQVHSPAAELPDQTVITAGLSKNMALGGYRIGFARIPDPELLTSTVGVASEIWSSLPAPMQEVAAYVLNEPEPVREHIKASVALHSAVANAAYTAFTAAGATCRPPEAGFYLYPDLEPLRDKGFHNGAQLTDHLLDRHGVGVLAGAEFGDDPAALRFRVATSLLYGDDSDQRWTALRSTDPVSLPWIAESLTQLRDVLSAVFHGE
ncbi:pyridoxal phosphate-dependent aminotransferase [Saccharomonospora sp. NPDC006951]